MSWGRQDAMGTLPTTICKGLQLLPQASLGTPPTLCGYLLLTGKFPSRGESKTSEIQEVNES